MRKHPGTVQCMWLLIREDGVSVASCSVEHAILLAGFLEGLDVAYRYRPRLITPRETRTFICFHCGLCGDNAFPGHEACSVHGADGIDCPQYDFTATIAYIYGAAAAKSYDSDADLAALEDVVEAGGWAQPDDVVYQMIQRYRPRT
jgi:hypothetical protein